MWGVGGEGEGGLEVSDFFYYKESKSKKIFFAGWGVVEGGWSK